MRVVNISGVDCSIAGVTVRPGEVSENIDDALARQLVTGNPGVLAIAPESVHTPEELEHADEKGPQSQESTLVVDPDLYAKDMAEMARKRR